MPRLELPQDCVPQFVGAGIIKTKAQIEQYAAIPEIAVQVIGSISLHENPYTDAEVFGYDARNDAAFNAVRLRNPGKEAVGRYLPEALKVVHAAGQLAIVSVTALRHEDPRHVLPILAVWAREMGADGVEFNSSCPNEGLDFLCEDVTKTLETQAKSREYAGDDFYMTVKVSAMNESLVRQYKAAGMAADGVVAINSLKRLVPSDPVTGKPILETDDGYAGMSGLAIHKLARANLYAWCIGDSPQSRQTRYDVWSIGGVTSGYEVYHRMHSGAFLVGAAQEFYRHPHPEHVAARFGREYQEAMDNTPRNPGLPEFSEN